MQAQRFISPEQRDAIRAMARTGDYTLVEISTAFKATTGQVQRIIGNLPYKKVGHKFIPQANALDDFEPVITSSFRPVDAPPGSQEKVEVMAQRVALGQPLWHVEDRVDYAGLTGSGLYRSSSGSEPGIREVSVSKFEEWLVE